MSSSSAIIDLAQQLLAALPLNTPEAQPREFFAVPGDAPRWLIPAAGGKLRWVLANWSPYRLASRLQWLTIRAANRLGALGALPNVTAVQLEADNVDWGAVGWNRSRPPIPVVYVGTPGPRRKAVVHLVEPESGSCEAIVKVPLCPGACDAIVREADVLTALAEERYSFSPHLLHLDRKRGVATQQYLPGRSGSRRMLPEYWELLRSLMLHDEHIKTSDWATAWYKPYLPQLADKLDLALVKSAFDELGDEHFLPACWVHGDLAPWNIRRRAQSAALIDWEEAQRGGLPLQDAYHFLHMQDFLFGRRPSSHCKDIEGFARTLGIAAPQCRKLEIAYLAKSYAACSSQDQARRTSFLRKTLALLVRERASAMPLAIGQPRHLRLVSSHPASLDSTRAELFDAVVAQLNQAQVAYCILSGYENPPDQEVSDVDIMFGASNLDTPTLLARAARSAGATLVQCIQHETTARYFILARQQGNHIVHLDFDCYNDYRRDARTWLPAEEVIAARRKYRSFYVPAVADEFTYYLLKKVLKQTITCHQLKRLQHLFARNPAACQRRVATFWPAQTALLQRAVVEQKLGWLQCQLPNLLAELGEARVSGHRFDRNIQTLRDARRVLRRITFPTGFSVQIRGANSSLRSELADGLVCELAGAFRRARRIWPANTLPRSIAQIWDVWAARVRSTLVVNTPDEPPAENDLRTAVRRLASVVARVLSPCDLELCLRSGQRDDASTDRLRRRTVYLDADSAPEQILQEAMGIIFRRLTLRAEKRLKLSRTDRGALGGTAAEHAALRSAGLD
jgi:hypothetical protein